MFSELINITNDYVKKINIFYSEFKEIQIKIEKMNPSSFRKQYEKFMNIIDEKKQEMNDAENVLNMSIENLNSGKEKINEINKLLEDIVLLSNKLQTGTLQGLTKQVIETNKIKANNEIEENVLENAKIYNELNDIHIGGRLWKSRTNKKNIYKKNRKSKKYRK